MKVNIGTHVGNEEFGEGVIVAMSKEWCIYRIDESNRKSYEIALPWDSIYIVDLTKVEPSEVESSIDSMEL